jgi:glycosyltransferase involved in cell wall biosynthesis
VQTLYTLTEHVFTSIYSRSFLFNALVGCDLRMTERRLRVLAVLSHVIQYAAPVFREFAGNVQIDFHVAYCSLRGAEAAHDPEFGAVVQWDVPLLDGYKWTHVPNKGSGEESFFGLFNPGLWKLIRAGNYDAVVCYTGYLRASFWIAYFAAKLSGASFLIGLDAITLSPRDGRTWKTKLKKHLWPRLFRMADQVIVPSSASRDLMLSLGLPSTRVTLVPCTVDNDWWSHKSSLVQRDKVREDWGASPADPVILFCAKLQSWKRPLDVLRAFAQTKLSNGILVFAGDGPLRSHLESEAVSLGLASRVRFLGFVNQSQLPSVYAGADVMVLSSEYEPFAVVVNEAMCCGCPVISSDSVGAARDLIEPVSPELIYPRGNVLALTATLRKIFADRERLKSISVAVRARMNTWSSKENVSATVEAVRGSFRH